MDMNMMDMGMGMGMDMSHGGMSGIGEDVNYAFARDYWYIAAVVVVALAIIRAINHIGANQRLKASRDASISQPTRPNSLLSQAWATATAVVREMGHPQAYVSLRGLTWATPPPLGRVLLLLCYWAVIVYFMSWRAVAHDADFYERIGYRNAWVTLTQLPMLCLLSTKVNIIALVVGTSHERLNWLHRWVARTMFVTATVHGFHFWTEWVRAGFVSLELETMPMVKYGLGAWAILLWSVVVGFVPIRRLSYEIWLLQHIVSSVVMLVLVYLHIPANGRYLFWMAVSFLLFDRAARSFLLLWQNLRLRSVDGSPCQGMRRVGHRILLRAVGESTTLVVIKDVHFKWSAGQHVYLWVPRLGPLEAHPYTIACAHHRPEGTCCCNSVQLIVRKHGGFSKRLHEHATKHPNKPLTGFLSGPYGAPPRWDIYDTMVLIGASTGASFTVAILESAAYSEEKACLKRVDVLLMARTRTEIEYYLERSRSAGKKLREKGVTVKLHVAITGSGSVSRESARSPSRSDSEADADADAELIKPADHDDEEKGTSCCCTTGASPVSPGAEEELAVSEYSSRPNLEALIREPVEQAWGETAVVACGGGGVAARTRNCVSRLSDERAVHKGTGAQGIYLFVEEYSF